MTAASREMLDEPPISHKKNYTANFTFILLPGLYIQKLSSNKLTAYILSGSYRRNDMSV